MKRIAHEIGERSRGGENLALIGIMRRGANLAYRLAAALKEIEHRDIPVGTLDISSYRDDGRGAPGDPRLLGRDIPFPLDGKRVILVDDVLYTGRTARAALDALSDLGLRNRFSSAVLIDRGERDSQSAPTTWARTCKPRTDSESTCGSAKLTASMRS